MKFVGGHWNPSEICGWTLDPRKSGEKHTIQAVRPENPEKNMQSKPSGPEIRKSEKKTYNSTGFAWLVVGCWRCRQPTQRPPVGAKKITIWVYWSQSCDMCTWEGVSVWAHAQRWRVGSRPDPAKASSECMVTWSVPSLVRPVRILSNYKVEVLQALLWPLWFIYADPVLARKGRGPLGYL